MLVSFEKSFLFIHVPKTGGTSMRAVLQRHAHKPQARPANQWLERFGISVNHLLGNYKDYRFRTHERIDVVAKRMPNDVFDRLFKFGFVRNPWDLLPSLYRFILKNKAHKRHGIVSKMRFGEFIEYAAAKNIADQKRLIAASNGEHLLDFVGRFERLAEDYQFVSQQIGLKLSLPHLNRTEGKSLSEYYDAQSIRTVQKAYRGDLDAFDYPPRPDIAAA